MGEASSNSVLQQEESAGVESSLWGAVSRMAASPSPVGDRLERGEASTSAMDQHVALHRTTSVPVNAGTAPITLSDEADLAVREGPLDPYRFGARPRYYREACALYSWGSRSLGSAGLSSFRENYAWSTFAAEDPSHLRHLPAPSDGSLLSNPLPLGGVATLGGTQGLSVTAAGTLGTLPSISATGGMAPLAGMAPFSGEAVLPWGRAAVSPSLWDMPQQRLSTFPTQIPLYGHHTPIAPFQPAVSASYPSQPHTNIQNSPSSFPKRPRPGVSPDPLRPPSN